MTIRVTILGSSGMFATAERACSGYLIQLDDTKVLMDCGAGAWRNLLHHTDPATLAGVILSHRHPDHVSDLFQVFHSRRYGGPEPMPEIPLWAPAETLDRLTGFAKELDQAFELHSVGPDDSIEVAAARFSFFSMAHPPETLGVRIERDGAVVAYTSDTGPGGDLNALASGASLFICEATLQGSDAEWEGHMTAAQAGAAASEAGVAKVLLTHLPPGKDVALSLQQARSTSGDAEVELAADGMNLEVR